MSVTTNTLDRLQARIDEAESTPASQIRIWRQGPGKYMAADAKGPIWEPQATVEAAVEKLLER